MQKLKTLGVATLYAIDGILEWRNAWENSKIEPACPWTMRPVLSDKVVCIGNQQARILASWGNTEKIEVVGIPRFDSLVAQAKSPQVSEANDRVRILVMTAKCPGFTDRQRQQILESLVDLKKWLQAEGTIDGKRIEVTWRLTGDLPDQVGVENHPADFSGQELAQILDQVDLVVTTPSTAQLESSLLGKPTALLDYTNSPIYTDAAWRISAAEQIAVTLQSMIGPSPARLELQRYLLHDNLQLETSATERMVSLIKAMLEVAANANARPAECGEIEFPSNLLPPVESDVNQIHLAQWFPSRAEFAEQDKTVLQAELAHARREIEHLNQVIESLQDELAQAHQIFDQIQNHPIAGPVVRTRQKLIDWVGRFSDRDSDGVNGSDPELNSAKPR